MSWLDHNIDKCGKHHFYGYILMFVNIFELRRQDSSLIVVQKLLENLNEYRDCNGIVMSDPGTTPLVNNSLTHDTLTHSLFAELK